MNLETPYTTTRTRAFYANLHLSYRVNDTGRGMNGPIFGREFCGGGNGNGMIYRQREVLKPVSEARVPRFVYSCAPFLCADVHHSRITDSTDLGAWPSSILGGAAVSNTSLVVLGGCSKCRPLDVALARELDHAAAHASRLPRRAQPHHLVGGALPLSGGCRELE